MTVNPGGTVKLADPSFSVLVELFFSVSVYVAVDPAAADVGVIAAL